MRLRDREQSIPCMQSHAPFLILLFMTNDLPPPVNKVSSFTIQAVYPAGSNHHIAVLSGLTTNPHRVTDSASNGVKYNDVPQA